MRLDSEPEIKDVVGWRHCCVRSVRRDISLVLAGLTCRKRNVRFLCKVQTEGP